MEIPSFSKSSLRLDIIDSKSSLISICQKRSFCFILRLIAYGIYEGYGDSDEDVDAFGDEMMTTTTKQMIVLFVILIMIT